MKVLLSGNEALARGAYEAGVKVGSAYPGTPSTEIFENLTEYKGELYAEWAPNEKVAAEMAYGASLAGVRSLCAMKHVGVNVAADLIFTAAYNGVGAGFVIITADDPSMHSSQNEQDNRHYARAAKLPLLEAANSQECKDFLIKAYEISEQFDTPVILRVTTRVCHSKSLVELGERQEVAARSYKRDVRKNIASPANAYIHHPNLEAKLQQLAAYASTSELNPVERGSGKVGVITTGIAYHYAKEVFPPETAFLKLGLSWPLPVELVQQFAATVTELYVIEELDPFLEEQIKALGIAVKGKDLLPLYHEFNPEVLRQCLLGEKTVAVKPQVQVVPRPPALCPGCPHRGFFYTLSKRKNTIIAGDIGCYTLGSAEPMNAMDTVICMGAGFSAAMGFAKAFAAQGVQPSPVVFGVVGDSTFFHSGLTGAVEISYNQGRVIPCVLDNSITSMTGQQDNPGTGKTLQGEPAPSLQIQAFLAAAGFAPILEVDPQDLSAMQQTVAEAVQLLESGQRPAIITRRPCLLIKGLKFQKELCQVQTEKCISCKTCLKVGCPALSLQAGKAYVAENLCVGCEVCLQVCPVKAIQKVEV